MTVRDPGLDEEIIVYDKLQTDMINQLTSNIMLAMNPVGTIYISVDDVNPATFIGGTWERFGDGRTIVGVDSTQTEFNTPNKTGGAKTHTLTVDEMPAHRHSGSAAIGHGAGGPASILRLDANGGLNRAAINVNSTGGGKSHNNLQPYITVYMFKRIS